MKALTLTTTVTLFVSLLIGCSTNAPETKNADSFIIKNVNIVDVENKQILPNKNVLVEGGLIKAIQNKHSSTAHSLQVYDGDNGYLTPGLIDMHVHIYEPAAYLMTLSHGVTHVRTMNGVPKQLEWRDKIESGEMIGSTSTVSSPIISGYKDAILQHGVETADEAKKAVTYYHQQGYDLIKAYGNLNQETLSAIVEQAKTLDIPVAKHGPHASGNMSVSELTGFQSFEHAEDIYQGPLNYKFTPQRLPAVIDEIKATQVPVTPTLSAFNQLTRLSNEKDDFIKQLATHYTPRVVKLFEEKDQVKRWLTSSTQMAAHNKRTIKFLQHVTNVFYQRGVELLVGSDSGVLLSPHGIATHVEMELMQSSGIETFDVIAAATINSAKALNLDNKIGKIASNFNADFIFTKQNPVDDLSTLKNPNAVIKRGQWYSGQQLNSMRDKAIEKRSIWQEITTLYQAL